MTHHIIVDNFNQGETLTYPLILLKGHVNKHTAECSNIEQDEAVEDMLLQYSDFEKSIDTSNNYFKCILNLKEGENKILLRYCCDRIEFNLEFRPRRTEYVVCPLYIICQGHDGRFQAPEDQENSETNACKRITLITRMLQCVTAEKLYEKSLTRKTFCLENECQIFRSSLSYLEARKMDEKQLWNHMAREIMKSEFGSTKRKYLGFLSCTRYRGENFEESLRTYEDFINITEAYIALGGGGLALFGSASLYTWPVQFEDIIEKFEDQTPVDRTRFLDDSCYRGTLGACFSTSLGSVLHELCHTLDLGHSEFGIMARGFDNIYKVFTPHLDDIHKISLKYHKTIEFKETLEPKLLSERLKNKPKEYEVIGSSKTEIDADDTFWTKSCATILNYHRWFNDFSENTKYVLKFDSSSGAFISTAGLRVIEIRRSTDELILMDWVFEGKILKYSFQIPLDVKDVGDIANCLVFAEDNVGNILKFDYSNIQKN